MRWTISLEGGPKRVNHAACAIGDKIYSFGGYCSGEVRSRFASIDVHVLDTSKQYIRYKLLIYLDTYRWTRVFGEQPSKKVKSVDRTQSFNDDSFSSGIESDGEMEFEIGDDEIMEEDDEMDPQLVWQYNPLAPIPDNAMEVATEEDGFKNVPYMRYGHSVVAYKGRAYLWGGRNDEFGASSRLYSFDPSKG
jgi:hypothetical protein